MTFPSNPTRRKFRILTVQGILMKTFFAVALIALVMALHAPTALGQPEDVLDKQRDKRAQTGMQFLSVSMSPRAAALGDAMTAIDNTASVALFYNPASMASMQGRGDLSLGIVQWVAEIDMNQAALAFSPSNGRFGVFGVSVMSVDYGELEGTVFDDSDQGYEDIGTFSPSALAVGIGYARALSDRFSVGGQAKFVRQSLGDTIMDADGTSQSNALSTPAFDFGVLYKTGFRSLTLAMSARNFAPAVEYQQESFELPLALSAGASMNLMDLTSLGTASGGPHAFLLTVEAGHPRAFNEQVRFGGEYRFMNLLALRAGYVAPTDDQGLSLGGGLNLSAGDFSISADYAFTQFDVLGNVNRFGVQVGF